MNKITKYFLVLSGLLVAWPAVSVFADEYDELAKDLCSVAISTISVSQGKIAILPFSYLDKRKSDGGSIVSERLTTRIVKLKKYQVIERELLQNLIQEQHLETSGAVSPETAKQIGKVLGVDAIISGTLLDIEDGMVEVNARLINTESAEVINTASVSIRKIWSDVSASPPPPSSYQQQQQQQQPQQVQQEEAPVMKRQSAQEEQPVYQKPAYVRRPPKLDGYIDLFSGLGSGTGSMDLTFDNSARVITGSELDFNLNGSNGYSKYVFNSLNTNGTAPLGFRIAGFGKHWGFDFECSYFEETVAKQNTTVALDNNPSVDFNFPFNDYLKVSVLNLMSVDLLYRFTDKMIQPYVGVGIGIALNTFTSPYILQSGGSTLNEVSAGFLLRAPLLGIRVNLGEDTSLFVEQRTIVNKTYFTRSYTGDETDNVSLTATQTIVGIGFKFASKKN